MAGQILTIFAGPNGSGKSTLKRELEALGAVFENYLNADDHALKLVGSEDERAAQAQIWVRTQRDNLMEDGVSYSFETVMSHPSHLDHAELAKQKGYRFDLIFVGLDRPELNVLRVLERVTDGGHSVQEDKIISRYQRTMAQLPAALALCDRARLFDNSDAQNPFILVAKKDNGQLDITVEEANMPSWLMVAVEKLETENRITEL